MQKCTFSDLENTLYCFNRFFILYIYVTVPFMNIVIILPSKKTEKKLMKQNMQMNE